MGVLPPGFGGGGTLAIFITFSPPPPKKKKTTKKQKQKNNHTIAWAVNIDPSHHSISKWTIETHPEIIVSP